jgi:NitT/TauT family transport system ATP-binding protein
MEHVCMSDYILEICNINKVFNHKSGNKVVLENIIYSLHEGERIVFVGPSGCGKSTLLRIVAGLESPTTGEVLLDSKKISGPGPDRCVVFQHSTLFPWLTVWENILFSRTLKRNINATDANVARSVFMSNKLVAIIGLNKYKNFYPKDLSGGMKQRVEIARALVANPRVLLMDEPFSALDAQTREVMHDLVIRLLNFDNKTLIFVTHDIEEAVYMGDKVVVLRSNPGTIDRIYDVPFGKERKQNLKSSSEFIYIKESILNDIRRLSSSELGNIDDDEYVNL